MKNIYELKLHEETSVYSDPWGKVCALRVPGGWMYTYFFKQNNKEAEERAHPIFVRYNREYQCEKCLRVSPTSLDNFGACSPICDECHQKRLKSILKDYENLKRRKIHDSS